MNLHLQTCGFSWPFGSYEIANHADMSLGSYHLYYTNGDTVVDKTKKDTESYDAQTVMKLQTGGKALSQRQNVWRLSAGATQFHPGRYKPDGTTIDDVWTAIPAQNIQVDGKALGSDGNLWVMLSDNQTVDVTPTVNNVSYYTFGISQQEYPFYINLQTSTTNVDLDTNSPEVCVGQTVTFALNGLPSSVTNMVGNWQLPAKYVNDHTNAVEGGSLPGSSENYFVNADLLANTNQTSGWFYNTNNGHVSVGLNLLFNNGQYVSVAANGNFTVYRPQMTQFTPLPPFTPMISTNALGYLVLGLGDQATGDGYMWFKAAVESKSPYFGSAGWTQLANRNVGGHARWGTYGQYWLDNSEFAQGTAGFSSGVATNEWSDGPGIAALANVTVTDNFKTYLCFKPPGDGIWVTLGIATWGWLGSESNGTLQSTNVIPPTYSDSDEFPVWPKTIYNGRLH